MIRLTDIMNEATKRRGSKHDYEIYHRTFTSAASEAIKLAKKQGFEVDEDSWFREVSTGPRKPGKGKTNRYTVELTKNGKPVKRMLAFQVYGLDGPTNNNYELTAYVS